MSNRLEQMYCIDIYWYSTILCFGKSTGGQYKQKIVNRTQDAINPMYS